MGGQNREEVDLYLKERLKSEFQFSSPAAKRVIDFQKENMNPQVMGVLSSNESQPATVCVTPTSVRVFGKMLGQGGQGEVHEAIRIPNDKTLPEHKEAAKQKPLLRGS